MRFKTEKFAGGILVDGQFLSYRKRSDGAINEYRKYCERQAEKQRARFSGMTLDEALNVKKKMYEKLRNGEVTQDEVRTWRQYYGI